MRSLLLDLIALAGGLIIALVIPTVYSDELRWTPVWEQSMETVEGTETVTDGRVVPVVVTTEDRFVRLDACNGDVLASGLRADVFTAAEGWFINQRTDSPRWAVQRWTGGPPRFYDAVGVPTIREDYLVEALPSGAVIASNLETIDDPEAIRLTATDGVVSFDLCTTCDPVVLVRGTLFGVVDVAIAGEGERTVYRPNGEPFGDNAPIVYGISAFDDRRYIAVTGTDPQVVRLFVRESEDVADGDADTEEDGVEDRVGGGMEHSVSSTILVEIPDDMAVRRPVAMHRIDGHLVVPLLDGLVVVSEDTAMTVRDIPGGFTVVDGVSRGTSLLLGGNVGGDGVAILLPSERTETTTWRWDNAVVLATIVRERAPAIVLQKDDTVIALEFGL
ncbi:MAG: hypothetical protein ACLFR8_04770 [Alkalispirochaeta sp.]